MNPSTKALERRFRFPVEFSSVARQYGYSRWRFAGDVLLFQVGRFFEFYQARDQEVAGLLGLRPLRSNRRGVRYGLPVRLGNWALRRLLRLNRSVALILERKGPYLNTIKIRLPAYRFEPLS